MRELLARIMRLLAVRRDLLRRVRDRRWSPKHRSGQILVTTALLLAFLMGLVAFAVDVGAMAVVRGELQRSADASALAAAAVLRHDRPLERATAEAHRFGTLNPVAAEPLDIQSSDVIVGLWDFSARQFTPRSDGLGNAARVTSRTDRGTLFFGRVAGNRSREFQASAVAAETPREIVVILDVSGATDADAQDRVRSIGRITQSLVQSTIAANRLIPDLEGGRFRDRVALITVDQANVSAEPLGGTDADYQQRLDTVEAFAVQWTRNNGAANGPATSTPNSPPNSTPLADALTLAEQQLTSDARRPTGSTVDGSARSFAEPLLLIVTDGVNVARPSTLRQAEAIRARAWPSFVIGVGTQTSATDLARLTESLGTKSRLVSVADQREFDSIASSPLTEQLRSVRTVLAD